MIALEPDFHFKPEIELYNLVEDPEENNNLAEARPDVVADLRARMEAFIAKREARNRPYQSHADARRLARARRRWRFQDIAAGLRYTVYRRPGRGDPLASGIAQGSGEDDAG